MKHTPATPLPWRYVAAPERGHYDRAHVVSDHFNRGGIVSGQGAISAGGICGPDGSRQLSTQNAAYIAHAANAYPKLVEALRLIEDSSSFNGGTSIKELQGVAREVLRSLGETE